MSDVLDKGERPDLTGAPVTEPKGAGGAIVVTLLIAALIVAGLLWFRPWKSAETPALQAQSVLSKESAAIADQVEQTRVEQRTPEEIAEDEAEGNRQVLAVRVRELLCQELAERYVTARTGVQLTRAVHLSEANGCGWDSIIQANAKTHDLTKEALEAYAGETASEVPSADAGGMDADRIEQLERKLEKVGDDVESARREARYRR